MLWKKNLPNQEIYKQSLESGRQLLESTDGFGDTPLMSAGFWGRPRIIQVLLDAGANIFARNRKGETALELAITTFTKKKHIDAIELLIKNIKETSSYQQACTVSE